MFVLKCSDKQITAKTSFKKIQNVEAEIPDLITP